MHLLFIFLILFLSYSPVTYAENEIRIGMTTALTGPLQQVGEDMKNGIEAYFSKINHEGGIQGKQLRLITKDDGYEPHRAAENMRDLIDNEKVVALVGNVGTPTAIVTVPIANEKKTLLFGALTGAEVLRKKENSPYVINYRASYAEEAEAMVSGLYSIGINPEEIAFFTQRDGFGNAGYNAVIQALERRGFNHTASLAHGRYTRNTLNVEAAVAAILESEIEPKAIIMAGGYEPSAKFIKLIQKTFPNMLFLNYSFVGSFALKQALGIHSNGIIVTQVVPNLFSDLGAAREYLQDLWVYKHNQPISFVSFEGYIVARIFTEALKLIKGHINSEKIIECLKNLKSIDIGVGFNINYTEESNQMTHKVWPMIIKNGQFIPIVWDELINFSYAMFNGSTVKSSN